MPTFFSTAVSILYDRVRRSSSGHGRDHDTLESLLKAPGVLEAAVTHSIHDFVCTAVQGEMDEETRTASLMGHLASNVNWYALVAHWTNVLCPPTGSDADLIKPCNLFWAQQSRYVESWRGADFGIAVRTGEDTLRIALYQAKRCDPEGNASLMRDVDDVATADEYLKGDIWQSDRITTDRKAAVDGRLKITSLHQVHRLEIWRRKGIRLLKEKHSPNLRDYAWCRYAFWHDARVKASPTGANPPTERSGKDLYNSVRNGLMSGFGSDSFKTRLTGTDFGASLCFGSDEDLRISSSDASFLLGKLKNMNIPDFIAIDETGSGEVDLAFWRAVFSVSHHVMTHVAGTGMATATPYPDVTASPQAPPPSPTPGKI